MYNVVYCCSRRDSE